VKDLDKENSPFARPQSIAFIGAGLPFLLGGMCSILASTAAPKIPFFDNPISVFCIWLFAIAPIMALVPKIFKWDWRTKYFGFLSFYVACASLLGVIPWLCILVYSALPSGAKLVVLFAYAIPIFWWCRRFILYYRQIFRDPKIYNFVYLEEVDVVYYSQKNDNSLIERKCGLKQFPSSLAITAPMALALLLIPFSRGLKDLVGLSFIFTFLTIGTLPITLSFLGLTTRGFLVFYFYPWKIKRRTGKEVYVDLLIKTAMPRKK
jgi:hypothetical protein